MAVSLGTHDAAFSPHSDRACASLPVIRSMYAIPRQMVSERIRPPQPVSSQSSLQVGSEENDLAGGGPAIQVHPNVVDKMLAVERMRKTQGDSMATRREAIGVQRIGHR